MRDASLTPLTHDHHHALAAIRRLRLSADESDVEHRAAAVGEFLDLFSTDTLDHFREEEEELFPMVVGDGDARDPLARVMIEHLQIHAAVKQLHRELDAGPPLATSMVQVAELLEQHIRFEEKVLFPLIETLLGAERLKGLVLAPRVRSTEPSKSRS